MKFKSGITMIILGALLAVLALCALTAYGTYAWMRTSGARLRLLDFATLSDKSQESLTLEPRPTLTLVSSAGDIIVKSAQVDQVQVTLDKVAWGQNEAEARVALQKLRVAVEKTPDELKLSFESPDNVELIGGRGGPDRIDFTILVPEQTNVRLETRLGKIDVDGIHGSVDLKGWFHPITVRGVQGALTIDNGNGDIALTDISAGDQDLDVRNTFGNIHAVTLAGRNIYLTTSNGELSIKGLSSNGNIHLENQFGKIGMVDFSGQSISIVSQNGEIALENGRLDGLVSVETNFADISLTQVSATGYSLKTQNGDIRVDGAGGQLDVQNSFGGITILNAEQAVLHLTTNNGPVEFNGSLAPIREQFIETSFGDVTVRLPGESAFQVVLETRFGKISSSLPLIIQGEVSDNRWEGTLNGGGPKFTVTTQNGDISLEALPPR